MKFKVYITRPPTGDQFEMQEGPYLVTMQATKANWRYIEAKLKEHGIKYELPAGMLESWPESGSVTFVEPKSYGKGLWQDALKQFEEQPDPFQSLHPHGVPMTGAQILKRLGELSAENRILPP